MNNITHILCSPLRRTLHTAQLGFAPLATRNLKIIAYPNLREIGGGPTCAGSKMSVLLEELAGEMKVDTSLVPEGWESNDSETGMDIRERARKVRSELWEFGQEALKYSEGKLQGNVEIAVVSHGGFLTWLVETKSTNPRTSVSLNFNC
jgi:broad specificity phosphatase PhoE